MRHEDVERMEVDYDIFVAMLVANGKTKAEAALQAKLSVGLRSYVMMGGKMIRIKKEEESS